MEVEANGSRDRRVARAAGLVGCTSSENTLIGGEEVSVREDRGQKGEGR